MNDLEKAIIEIKHHRDSWTLHEISNESCNVAISALEHQLNNEPGAIEFLRKAKAICDSKPTCHKCILSDYCGDIGNTDTDEADLVRKVMDYRLEDKDENTVH